MDIKDISAKIKQARIEMEWSQQELADALYVSRQAVSKWEMGKSLPSLDVLLEMTKLFAITIDYLMDDVDLKEDDYQIMFMQYPRESVIYHFLNQHDLNLHVKYIFYLLEPKERKQMIDQVLHQLIKLDMNALWICLSPDERMYVIANMLSKGLKEELFSLVHMMTNEEKKMMNLFID